MSNSQMLTAHLCPCPSARVQSQQLLDVFRGFRGSSSSSSTAGDAAAGAALLAQLRRGVEGSSMARWHDCWTRTVLPVLEGAVAAAAP